MRRVLLLAVLVIVAVAVVVGGSSATGKASGHSPEFMGVIGKSGKSGKGGPPPKPKGAGNLSYHGGPVEHTNVAYAIYWVPSGYSIQSGYDTVINKFFSDVAADSGKATNVYWSDTQYSDSLTGNIAYSSQFGGSYTDTNALPASGCKDTATKVCLTDAQLQAEIQKDIAAAHWTAGPTTEFFLFTAKGIGSCSGSSCAFTSYCAYHNWIGSGSSAILYANMPYADTVPSACDWGSAYHPNGSDADATLNVTSHEQNETITDPQGNAWYDAAGYENGDKCAWIFGPTLGSTSKGQYDQTINGDHYWLQEEYSNATRNCVASGT